MNTPQFDPRSESNLITLLPAAQRLARAFLTQANDGRLGPSVQIKIIAGTRTYAEQDALYAQGRTAPGPIVTNARGGYSNHNFGIAFDIGVFKNDEYLGDSPIYVTLGAVGKSLGLTWGGDWTSFPDQPHFQLTTPYSLIEARELVAQGDWNQRFA